MLNDNFDFIRSLSPVVAGKYKRLEGRNKHLADKGIFRHIKNCRKFGCDIDISAIHEVVNDARKGRAIYAESV